MRSILSRTKKSIWNCRHYVYICNSQNAKNMHEELKMPIALHTCEDYQQIDDLQPGDTVRTQKEFAVITAIYRTNPATESTDYQGYIFHLLTFSGDKPKIERVLSCADSDLPF